MTCINDEFGIANEQGVRFASIDELVSSERHYDGDIDDDEEDEEDYEVEVEEVKEIPNHPEANCKDSIISSSTPKDIPTVPTSAVHLLTSRLLLRTNMHRWPARDQRDVPFPLDTTNAACKSRVLDTTIFTRRLNLPRLIHAYRLALGMKVANDMLLKAVKQHIDDLKELGAAVRNKMHRYREAKRKVKKTALPKLVEEEDEDSSISLCSPLHVHTTTTTSASTSYGWQDEDDNANDKVKIIYKGFCVGTIPRSDVAKYAKWDKILDRRQNNARRRKRIEKKKEIIRAWVSRAGKWMGAKCRAAATRVMWQECRGWSGRYGAVMVSEEGVYVRCEADGCPNVWCVQE